MKQTEILEAIRQGWLAYSSGGPTPTYYLQKGPGGKSKTVRYDSILALVKAGKLKTVAGTGKQYWRTSYVLT